MFKNYVIIAWRNIISSKVFSLINIMGLSISMACCLLISMFIWNELHYDTFHKNVDHIYRITEKQNQGGALYNAAVTPGPLAPALQKDFPEIEQAVRFGKWSGLFKNGANTFEENNIFYTDNSIFKVFDFELVKGDPAIALSRPTDIVITETTADKYFGKDWRNKADLLGQTFRLNNETDFMLTGIAKDPPFNSSIRFDYLLSFQYIINDKWGYQWGSNNYHTYVQLKAGTDITSFRDKLRNQLPVYNSKTSDELQLQPLAKQYLYSDFDFNTDWGVRSNIKYIQLFGGVAILLLIIACVNFINLSTARSIKRAVEVGVRKAVGASKRQLMLQFIMESVVITLIAGILALVLAQGMIPLFNTLSGTVYSFPYNSVTVIAFLSVSIAVIGFAAGIYPAFILSSFIPVKVLKGVFNIRSGVFFRQSLMVLQFTIAVVLSIGAIFMYRQLLFMQNKDLGFNKDELINVRLAGNLKEKGLLYKRDLQQQQSIAGVSAATMSLVNVGNSSNLEWEGMTPKDEFLITQANADPDLIPITRMKLLQGKNFSAQLSNDTATYIINEAAAKRMGYNENAIGKKIKFWGAEGLVIGVVKNFNFKPLSTAIEPFIFRYQPKDFYFNLFVKAKAGKANEAIAEIKKFYRKYESAHPLQYSFVDEELNKVYAAQQRTADIILFFCCLVVFVACIGLFGLVTFSASQRTKEIGIRKILGASVAAITGLLSKDFIKLIIISIFIAAPVAWYAVNKWLQSFVYRINIDWWVFALAGIAIIAVAMVTVSFQTIKAAIANPVKSLRTE